MTNLEYYFDELREYLMDGTNISICDLHNCIADIKHKPQCTNDEIGCVADKECLVKSLFWLKKEYKKPILNEVEREYLKGVVKPFRNRIESIRKCDVCWGDKERVWVNFNDKNEFPMPLPTFKKDTMYKGMVLGEGYTVEELGL